MSTSHHAPQPPRLSPYVCCSHFINWNLWNKSLGPSKTDSCSGWKQQPFFVVVFFQVRFGVNQMLTLAVSNSNSTDNISTINPTYWLGANTAIAVVFILIIKTSTYSAFKLCVDLPMMQSSCLCFLSSCISSPSDSDWTKTRSGVYNWISLYQNGTFDILLLLVPVILLIRVLRHVTKTMECEIIQRT